MGCFPSIQNRGCEEFPLGDSTSECDACTTYCNVLQESCAGIHFGSVSECSTTCNENPTGLELSGTPGATLEPTLACRITEAKAGRCDNAGLAETSACPSAECLSYCNRMSEVCPEQYQNVDCLSSCVSFPKLTTDTSSDSLECRIGQLTQAENLIIGSDFEAACAAAGLSGGDFCGEPCEIYCNITERNCSNEVDPNTGESLAVYPNRGVCEATCALFGFGPRVPDQPGIDGDTVGCRTWHAAAAGPSRRGSVGALSACAGLQSHVLRHSQSGNDQPLCRLALRDVLQPRNPKLRRAL